MFLSKRKLTERGFNQTRVLFEPLMKKYSIKNINIMERVSYTKPLFNMTAKDRKLEVSAAFQVKNDNFITEYTDKSLLICDDIFTTGSTVDEIIQTLKPFCFKSIKVLTLTKTMPL